VKKAHPVNRPSLGKDDINDFKKVFQLVMWFINNDKAVKNYINITAHLFFEQGFRPLSVSENTPAQLRYDIEGLEEWLAYQVYIDLLELEKAAKCKFERFLDKLDKKSAEALLKSGEIAIKYDIAPQDYLSEKGVQKITDNAEKAMFKINYLTDNILSSELIILASLYNAFFGDLYCVKT